MLVRHAMPESATTGAHEPSDDERPLSDEGRLAARHLAEDLAGQKVTAIYSSPYLRARQTVEPLASALGLDVRIEADLRERRVSRSALPAGRFVEALKNARQDPDLRLPGGESTNDVLARAFRVFEAIASEARGVAVAATHGGLISIVRWHLGAEFSVEEVLASPMPAVFPMVRLGGEWHMDQ